MKLSSFSEYTDDDIDELTSKMKCDQNLIDIILEYTDKDYKSIAQCVNELLSSYAFPTLEGTDYQIVLQYILNVKNSWRIIRDILKNQVEEHKFEILIRFKNTVNTMYYKGELSLFYDDEQIWQTLFKWFIEVQKMYGVLNDDTKWNGSWTDTSPREAIMDRLKKSSRDYDYKY